MRAIIDHLLVRHRGSESWMAWCENDPPHDVAVDGLADGVFITCLECVALAQMQDRMLSCWELRAAGHERIR